MRLPRTPSARRNSSSSAAVSDSATQSAERPACWIAPRAFGPRATICAGRIASRNASSMPASSTASIHPRKPTPVVTTTTSGRSAISALDRAISSSSSMCGTIVSAGASRTVAPCRSSAAVSSPDRRSTGRRIVHPANAADSNGAVRPAPAPWNGSEELITSIVPRSRWCAQASHSCRGQGGAVLPPRRGRTP